jgi:hypothetical protein
VSREDTANPAPCNPGCDTQHSTSYPTPPDPWAALANDYPRVKVFIRIMPDKFGQTIWDGSCPYIELAHDLGPIQQRATLVHEMMHIDRGRPCSAFCGVNEREVVEATARWLLPDVGPIGRALAEFDLADAALALGVPQRVLADRLACMTDSETRELGPALRVGTSEPAKAAARQRQEQGR